jgi:hypothetical protein
MLVAIPLHIHSPYHCSSHPTTGGRTYSLEELGTRTAGNFENYNDHDRITMNSRFMNKQGMMSTHQDNSNFIQLCISNALQEVGESENNRTNTLLMEDNSSKESDDYEHNSLLYYYLENDVTQYRNSSTENYQDISTIATPSLASDTDSDIDTTNMRDDKTSLNSEEKDDQDISVCKIQNGDTLPILTIKWYCSGKF